MAAQRKAKFKIYVTRREMLYVGDQPDHTLMLTEMEGEPLEYSPGVAGEFVSRRSVGFHDRIKGEGPMQGYAVTHYEYGAVFSRFEGERKAGVTSGTWRAYKGTGKLAGITGTGTFTVKPSDRPNEYILEMEGTYDLSGAGEPAPAAGHGHGHGH
ncbi:MAG: hypothetical protein WHT07_10260 [Desulfobaccales bacterium]